MVRTRRAVARRPRDCRRDPSEPKIATQLRHAQRATTIRPDDISGRKLLANLRLQTGKTEEAVRLLEAIVAEAPNLVDVHVLLATAYNRLKRTDDAERERAIIDKLNGEINKILAEPELQAKFIELGVTARGNTPAEMTALLARDIGQWREVVERARLEKQ